MSALERLTEDVREVLGCGNHGPEYGPCADCNQQAERVAEFITERLTQAKADAYDEAIKSCRIMHTINPYRPDESDW